VVETKDGLSSPNSVSESATPRGSVPYGLSDSSLRSLLFVPGTRLDRIPKALSCGSHGVILDLEDAVAEKDKAAARNAALEFVPPSPLFIRINATSSHHFDADVMMIKSVQWVAGVVLPMVTSVSDVVLLRDALGEDIDVLAVIENAKGLLAVEGIAHSGATRLALGSADYSTDLGCAPTDALLGYPRSRLAVASAAAGLPAPIDGPTLALSETTMLSISAGTAKELGMGGKFCIHPSQVEVVNAVFGPTEEELNWARSVMLAFDAGPGVSVVDGEMVDEPVFERARRLLSM
jgi:citrate lyase subunit beta / citryl-CoA lyase